MLISTRLLSNIVCVNLFQNNTKESDIHGEPVHGATYNATISSSRSNPRRMYYRYPNWMNYNVKLRRRDIHQNNQIQESQEHIMVKPEPMVIQQQSIDTLGRMQQFIFFLCVTNAIMFVLLLLKNV
ncbi:hypothetical protein AMTRI_Chr08g164100 [Amborella trichopoda]